MLSKLPKEKYFYYGVAYFRPPNPPRQQHRFHLTKIKRELKFYLIRIRMQWNAIHQQKNRFVWDEYDEIFNICEELGLRVLLETNIENAPYWLERAHPESRYVSANGQVLELGPYDSTQFGGYPGLCFHHGIVIEESKRYLTELANHFKDRPGLMGYDCWNEPHLEPAWVCNYWANMGDRLFCYCEESRRAFRRWLAGKYRDIETLNTAWGRAYGEWDDINPPNRHGCYADWLDWGRFWFDQLSWHMQWRYETLKAADRQHFVMSHSGAVPPFLGRPNAFIHNWSLAKPVDMWGTSFAPKAHNWDLATCAGVMDATRSAARGKPFWISEMSGGSCYIRGFAKTPLTTANDYRSWNWMAAFYGAKATIHWCYLEESTGPEAGNFGLIRANGQTTERARAASKTAELLRKYSHILKDWQPVPHIGILYDPDNSMQLFAMEGNDDLYVQSHIGYYRAVWQADLYARYVTYDSLDDLKGLKVLIVPMCLTLPERVAASIAGFVNSGGVLLADTRMGLLDERGYIRPTLPAGGLTEVVGAVEQESLCSDPENRPSLNNPDNESWPEPIYNGPEIDFVVPVRVSVRAHGYLTPLTITTGGQSIAECLGHCVGVMKRYGKGCSYYFGTYLGLSVFHKQAGAGKLIAHILSENVQPKVRGGNLRPRLIEKGEDGLLAIFNDSRVDTYTESIAVPVKYKKAVDIYTDKKMLFQNAHVKVKVPPDDAVVLHLW
ncbi:MAG: beta-galactosidase [Candidatus Omnitrophota bacterium]